MMTLIIPSYGGGINVERTIESCRHVCNETIIISTAPYKEDTQHFQRIADQVVTLPWNYVFHHGHGELHNQGTAAAKNDWLLLLGTAETWAEHVECTAEPLCTVPERLSRVPADVTFRCNHHGDPHTWKRVWNRTGGTRWSGIMHEEIEGGMGDTLLFRMQDTEKVADMDPLKNETLRWIKALSYNYLYAQLLDHPERLGAANNGWLKFVKGAEGSIRKFCADNSAMLSACLDGDFGRFRSLVFRAKEEEYRAATGVNFQPQGYENLLTK
jgi:hypothetical protein